MFKLLTDFKEHYRHQQIVDRLFNLELFNPHTVVFAQPVFKKEFAYYYFLNFNGWFNEAVDYQRLQKFIQDLKEPAFYGSAPVFCLLNTVEFSADCSHTDFVKGFTYSVEPQEFEHNARNIGLRLSAESFIYGESLAWAMVNDVVSDLVIIGLEESASSAFGESFGEEYFDIQGAVEKLESDHGGKMAGADRAIANYG
jgi:hypothetical protein